MQKTIIAILTTLAVASSPYAVADCSPCGLKPTAPSTFDHRATNIMTDSCEACHRPTPIVTMGCDSCG